jgi:hypothetical protein
VISIYSPARLCRCLDCLLAEVDEDVEVIVARDWARDDTAAGLPERYPRVRWVQAPGGTTVPHLRLLAVHAATQPRLALIEDDCLVASGWCEAVRGAHADPDVAIGGAVEPGRLRGMRNWAIYFYEYGRFMRPLPRSGPIAGNHVLYKKAALLEAADLTREGVYDAFLHAAWHSQGRRLSADDRVVVTIENDWPPGHLWRVPFHHGRAYAARRFAGRSVAARAAFAVLGPALPLLQAGRIMRLVVTRHHLGLRFVQALPAVLVFGSSWALGEMTGVLLGGGRSASEWR